MNPQSIKPKNPIQVLIIDDSAVVRQVVQAVLSQENMSTMAAADPIFALEKMKQFRPDVIVLDLEMPRMDGLTFLRKLMIENPIPVVICSALATERTELGFKALEEGAVAVIGKPKVGVKDFLTDSAKLFVNTVREASQVKLKPRESHQRAPEPLKPLSAGSVPKKIVAIGASTGGTEALRDILSVMPANAPGFLIVQHIPKLFSAALANQLNAACSLKVKEAEQGDIVMSGQALIAPGDQHMMVRRKGANLVVELTDGPLVSRHRPSIDVLFQSVATAAGASSIGVILTGMGDDGAEGLLAMRQSGANTAAQDEASSVVYGMPKEAAARGGAAETLPLSKIAPAILKWAL